MFHNLQCFRTRSVVFLKSTKGTYLEWPYVVCWCINLECLEFINLYSQQLQPHCLFHAMHTQYHVCLCVSSCFPGHRSINKLQKGIIFHAKSTADKKRWGQECTSNWLWSLIKFKKGFYTLCILVFASTELLSYHHIMSACNTKTTTKV